MLPSTLPRSSCLINRVCIAVFALGVLTALSACGRFPYKLDVRQGNYITQDKVDRLEAGMSQDQVRALLGAPLLIDGFHADRWDYIFLFTSGVSPSIRRQLVVFFADGKVSRVVRGEMGEDAGEVPAAKVPHLLDMDKPENQR